MARYTCSFTVASAIEQVNELLIEVLQSCHLDVIYNTSDYLIAREYPGQVAFARLVTVEVLIDKTTVTGSEIRMNLVVKNEELPLQVNNHCHQIFQLIHQAILNYRHWQLIENVVG